MLPYGTWEWPPGGSWLNHARTSTRPGQGQAPPQARSPHRPAPNGATLAVTTDLEMKPRADVAEEETHHADD